jgi:hypothetical protein
MTTTGYSPFLRVVQSSKSLSSLEWTYPRLGGLSSLEDLPPLPDSGEVVRPHDIMLTSPLEYVTFLIILS